MRSVLALMRASFLTASSYRLGMVLSVAGLLATFVPLYFISGALQPLVQQSIRFEGGQYFGFLIVGMSATFMLTAAVSSVPAALGASISSGTLEALFVTRTPLYQILLGMVGYSLIWNALRSLLLIAGAAVIGVQVAWPAAPLVLVIMALMVVAYFAIGLIAGALVMVFRTSGPFISAVIAASGLLGGVYYSTSVIPSWLQNLSGAIPLTYALRAIRMLLLGGAPAAQVAHDVADLAIFAAGLLAVSITLFVAALRHARATGTLSQY
jgi:ABC-2 type transport system permease protein